MTTQVLEYKQGGTFSYTGTVLLPAGTWSATCSLIGPDGRVADLEVDVQPLETPTATATHSIVIDTPSTDPNTWPLGVLRSDVFFEDASVTPVFVPTDTFHVNVVERQTPA